jgi:hypothetical protein
MKKIMTALFCATALMGATSHVMAADGSYKQDPQYAEFLQYQAFQQWKAQQNQPQTEQKPLLEQQSTTVITSIPTVQPLSFTPSESQPVEKPDILAIAPTFDWTNLYSGSLSTDQYKVPASTRNRAFIDSFCAQFNGYNKGANDQRLHEDVRIKAIMTLTGRTDLGRGTAELTFDSLCFNDCENRLLTLTNMSHLGYPNVAKTHLEVIGKKARRHPGRTASLNLNGWNSGWKG